MLNYPFGPKRLDELNFIEWESLCDGCGKCCLVKMHDIRKREIQFTNIACKLLDTKNCRCSDYGNRRLKVPDCRRLTQKNVPNIRWLPDTCAYRLVHERRPLPEWHHLISGDKNTIHQAGQSVRDNAVPESAVQNVKEHILGSIPFTRKARMKKVVS